MKVHDDWVFRSWGIAMALLLAGGAVMAADVSDTATVLGKLHHSNQMEIEMGRLAQLQGHANGVTTFATTLILEHTSADQQVAALAEREKIDLTAAIPPGGGRQDDKTMAKLRTLKGMAFDRAFARAMLDDHTHDLHEAKAARDRTTDGRLKLLLLSLIPVLEQHRDIAQRLVDTLGTIPNAASANTSWK
jgi:putative membrane protein